MSIYNQVNKPLLRRPVEPGQRPAIRVVDDASRWLALRERLRALLDPQAVEADLDRLEAEQYDGGWDVDWAHWSAAGRLEWRGWATVRALRILRSNGRL